MYKNKNHILKYIYMHRKYNRNLIYFFPQTQFSPSSFLTPTNNSITKDNQGSFYANWKQ